MVEVAFAGNVPLRCNDPRLCAFCGLFCPRGRPCSCGALRDREVGFFHPPYFPWIVGGRLVYRAGVPFLIEGDFDVLAARRRGSPEALRVLLLIPNARLVEPAEVRHATWVAARSMDYGGRNNDARADFAALDSALGRLGLHVLRRRGALTFDPRHGTWAVRDRDALRRCSQRWPGPRGVE